MQWLRNQSSTGILNKLFSLFLRTHRITKHLRQRAHSHEETAPWARKAIEVLARKLARCQGALEELERAIMNPQSPSGCVLLPRNGLDDCIQMMEYTAAAHAICCKLWRWPDLQSHFELRSLSCCSHPLSRGHADSICVNPFHYERVQWSPDMPAILVPRLEEPMANLPAHEGVQRMQEINVAGHCRPGNYDLELGAVDVEPPFPSTTPDIESILNAITGSPGYQQQEQPAQSSLTSSGETSATLVQEQPQLPQLPLQQQRERQQLELQQQIEKLQQQQKQLLLEQQQDEALQRQWLLQQEQLQELQVQQSQQQNQVEPAKQTIYTRVEYEEPEVWVKASYYEFNRRVGELFECKKQVLVVDGFTNPDPHSERFSIGLLTNAKRTSPSDRVRRCVGRGIQLHRANGRVMLQNHSPLPVYVQSRCANAILGLNPITVVKLLPNASLKVFDNELYSNIVRSSIHYGFETVHHLTQFCVVRLSFGKGWGTEYQRGDVTQTPCWIEASFPAPLQWLDKVLLSLSPAQFACSSVS